MEAKAIAKYIRIAPRKLRIVINLIRGKSVGEAFAILKYTPKVGSEVIEKVLRSAVANAEHNFDMNVDNLIVSYCAVDQSSGSVSGAGVSSVTGVGVSSLSSPPPA